MADSTDNARCLVLAVLRGEKTRENALEVFDDDLLLFAVATLAQHDPDWLLRELVNTEHDVERRLDVMREAPEPIYSETVRRLKRKRSDHPMWPCIRSGPDVQPTETKAARLVLGLTAANEQERDRAAADLGDLLERHAVSDADYQMTVNALLTQLRHETAPVPAESICNSLAIAANDPNLVDGLDLAPLEPLLNRLPANALLHALTALGLTHQKRFRVSIERFASHERADVRKAVEDALAELDHASY